MKLFYRLALIVVMATVIFLSGCSSNAPALRCAYQIGDTQTITFSTVTEYQTWVKMPDKDPTDPDKRQTIKDLTLDRTVESVDGDGNAIMNVTFKSVKLVIDTNVRNDPKHKEYSNDGDKFLSDWPKEPKLVGKSYKIKIAPDTSVLEVIGLNELTQALRQEIKLKDGDEFSGVVSSLIDENEIKSVHEREFMKFAPAKIAMGKPYVKVIPIPDSMIKAQAIRKIFTPTASGDMIEVVSTIEPLYQLPEGMEEPEEPNNFGQALIKDKSDMQELEIVNTGKLDAVTRKQLSETIKLNCVLILDGDKLGFGNQNAKDKPKGAGGEMFTTINSTISFEAK